ncbi:alpha/beta hydrolase fold protein [Hyaloraphidium curvatum]|nr:alpha/beta hydrolase fold protein [Hyaloraphidium curvatum]
MPGSLEHAAVRRPPRNVLEGWTAGNATVNGVRLRYHRSGGSGHPIVLVHGLTDHAMYWAALARDLARDYDVVLYDSRGHGDSEGSPSGYTLEQAAADLVALVEALKLDKPVLIGHSFGGSTSTLAAALNPGRFSAVILEDPVFGKRRVSSRKDLMRVRTEWGDDLLRIRAQDIDARLEEKRRITPGWSEEDYLLWSDSKEALNLASLEVMISFDRDWLSEARQIDCPLLVITGEPSLGAIITAEGERDLLEARPMTAFKRINGTGHQIRREKFGEYLGHVRSFLGEHLVNGAAAGSAP